MVTQQQRAYNIAVVAQAIELAMQALTQVNGASLEEASVDARTIIASEINNEINNRGE